MTKRIWMTLLTLLLIFSMQVPVFALDKEKATAALEKQKKTGVLDTTEVDTWFQGRIPQTDKRTLKKGTSYTTIGNGGCSYFAAAYMLLKMGDLDLLGGETPVTVLDKMESIDGYLSFGKMDFLRIREVWSDVTCCEYKTPLTGTMPERVEQIREKLDNGYFVIATVVGGVTDGHYIFIDSITDDGDMIIGDSAFGGTRWSDTFGPSGSTITDISVFRSSNVNSYDCPSIYEYKEYLESGKDFSLKPVSL
ncbi:MAG: hypothetical protein IJ860_07040 [Eubacterium sp.]|nr:hypothetical protein [Eubacterium sp.]